MRSWKKCQIWPPTPKPLPKTNLNSRYPSSNWFPPKNLSLTPSLTATWLKHGLAIPCAFFRGSTAKTPCGETRLSWSMRMGHMPMKYFLLLLKSLRNLSCHPMFILVHLVYMAPYGLKQFIRIAAIARAKPFLVFIITKTIRKLFLTMNFQGSVTRILTGLKVCVGQSLPPPFAVSV